MANLFIILFFSILLLQPVFPFQNRSIDRDIIDSRLSDEYREELKGIQKNCQTVEGLQSIEVPKNHFSSSSGKIPYYFQYRDSSGTDDVIVYIPGGPGGGSIGSIFEKVPYDFVYLDPRGIGCNYGREPDFTPFEVSTVQHARDILAIIKHLEIQSYVIYGKSYGTLVATVLSDLIAKDKFVNPPRAVILEGVIGKFYTDKDGHSKGFLQVAKYFIDQNPEISDMFYKDSLPLGLSAKYWGDYLSTENDKWNEKLSKLIRLKSHLSGNSIEQEVVNFFLEDSRSSGVETKAPTEIVGDYIFYHVACREITEAFCGFIYDWNHSMAGFSLFQTETSFIPQKYQGIQLTRPFDSVRYEIPFPLYYLQGTADPKTPFLGAEYHFKNQLAKRGSGTAPIVYQSFWGVGHSPLMSLLWDDGTSCLIRAFESFFKGTRSLESVFNSQGLCVHKP